MPIVEITKAVREMSDGQALEVLATDLAFKLDVEAWSRRTGHSIESLEEGPVLRALIRIHK
ncbi:MAG: sulfurtransferase TusA family protein [Planctomycetaceae bacterium]|nr:sulfurtransferase TusA family protein [Planctomycetaceae bacterium]